MTVTREQMDRIIDAHFGFEARDDVAGVLGTLSERVEHDVVGNPAGPVTGREAAEGFYHRLFADLSDGEFASQRRYYGEGFVVDESIWSGVASGNPFGLQGRGRPLSFRILHIFELADNGEITRENVWLDLAAIQAQLSH